MWEFANYSLPRFLKSFRVPELVEGSKPRESILTRRPFDKLRVTIPNWRFKRRWSYPMPTSHSLLNLLLNSLLRCRAGNLIEDWRMNTRQWSGRLKILEVALWQNSKKAFGKWIVENHDWSRRQIQHLGFDRRREARFQNSISCPAPLLPFGAGKGRARPAWGQNLVWQDRKPLRSFDSVCAKGFATGASSGPRVTEWEWCSDSLEFVIKNR